MINGFRDVFAIERNASGMRLNSIQNVNNKHAEKQIAIRMAMANGSLNSTIKLVGFFFRTNTLAKCLHKAPMKFKINEFAVRKAQTFDLQYTYSLVCVCISRNGKLLHRIMSRRWHRRKHIILHTFITRIYISFSIRWIQKVASFNRRKIYLIFGDAHVLYAICMEFGCGYHKFSFISVTHFCCFVQATAAVAVKLTSPQQTNLNCAQIYGVNKNCLLFKKVIVGLDFPTRFARMRSTKFTLILNYVSVCFSSLPSNCI